MGKSLEEVTAQVHNPEWVRVGMEMRAQQIAENDRKRAAKRKAEEEKKD